MPNDAIGAPAITNTPQTSLEPRIMQLHYPPVGDGYVQGSSPQAMDDKNAAKAFGMDVRVPIK